MAISAAWFSWRAQSRRPPLVDLDVDELLADPLLGLQPAWSPEDGALGDDVTHALAALPNGFREVVWLVDVEELTLAEAAMVLELPPGTVASRAYRARRLLRELLEGRGPRRKS